MKLDHKFINIPFKSGGRDFDGADCWGVAILFYKEYFGIDLPSFRNEYYVSDTARLKELIALHREGWERVTKPSVGDLVLFKVLGQETHIGVYIGNDKFLHALENQSSVVQSLTSLEWSKRIVGYFRYSENAKSQLPDALSTKKIHCEVPDGTTIADFVLEASKISGVDYSTFSSKFTVLVNGAFIPDQFWKEYKLNNDDIVEYRLVAEKSVVRLVLVVALAYFAPYIAANIGLPGVTAGAAGISVTGVAGALSVAAVTIVGNLLIDAIFPIRPPEPGADPEVAKQQYLFNAGQNRVSKYESIPVVLGKVRVTPPVAANPYAYDRSELGYLRMILCWGYGPLKVEDIRVGSVAIDQLISGTTGGVETYADSDDGPTRLETVFKKYGGGRIADIEQARPNLKLVNEGNPLWYDYTFSQPVNSIDFTFNFPQGLRKLKIKGDKAGDSYEALCQLEIQVKPVGSNDWNNGIISRTLKSSWTKGFTAPYFRTYVQSTHWDSDGYYKIVYLYQWHTVCLDFNGDVVVLSGIPSNTQDYYPDQNTINILNRSKYSIYEGGKLRPLKPSVPDGYVPLFRLCVKSVERESEYGSSSVGYIRTAYENIRDTANWNYVGLVDVYSFNTRYLALYNAAFEIPTYATLSAGTATSTSSSVQYITLGDSLKQASRDESELSFSKRKDPFSFTRTISLPTLARYDVRVRRINASWPTPDNDPNSEYQLFHDCFLTSILGFKPSVPVVEPKNCMLALTAVDLQATDQINGSLEGINGLVTTIALDFEKANNTWIERETQNPASLFRYVLEHPANAQRVRGDISSQVHLSEIEDWHRYCDLNGFQYNDMVAGQKSLLDVLRDIASAGRASPVLRDGKWTVVIDKPRDTAVQYFTPHNSWGFESTKSIPKQPDAFRVVFPNEEKGFQEDELFCFNTGKNLENAELYEELRLPGITNAQLAARHARWHLAQLKLRQERYTLNVDMEYLVCSRGDLVRVSHDVPLWGTGSGRIQEYVNSTTLKFDEEIYLESSKTYTLRIRLSNGSSITRQVTGVLQDGYYSGVSLTSGVTADEGSPGNLFMLGELDRETQELIVLSIEPAPNYTARLTLVDYAPDLYTLEDLNNSGGLASDYDFPSFDSNITLPAKNLVSSITVSPIIQDIRSDESVLEVVSPGVFQINLVPNFKTLDTLPSGVAYIEVGIKLTETPDIATSWYDRQIVSLPKLSAKFSGVQEGQSYSIRARYVSIDGKTGPWSTTTDHVVVGKTSKPSDVVVGTPTILSREALLELSWNSNPELDLQFYEIRSVDADWGLPGYIWRGSATKVALPLNAAGTETKYYIKAADYSSNYSTVAGVFTTTVQAPSTPVSLQSRYSTTQGVVTSTTNSTVTLTWSAGATLSNQLAFKHYKLIFKRTDLDTNPETVFISGTSYTTRADWLGTATLTIISVDTDDNESAPAQLSVVKLAPPAVTGVVTEVVDNNVFLRWNLPNPSSLPISHVLIKRGTDWNNPDSIIGEKSGTFTSIIELAGGQYTYMIAAVDTDGRESETVSIPATVSQPPDFIFNAEYYSNFTGPNTVLQNSIVETNTGHLLMLVNTTETWATHFTSRSWTGPSSQISAGYPIYAQPGLDPASYREVFDYGTVLANSSITISVAGSAISGAPVISASIETSTDGVSWSTPVSSYSTFATNFRYVRIIVYATKSAPGDLYLLESVTVRLDSKQKNDSGNSTAVATDTLGTIVNFSNSKEFIDVTSITLTPAGTSPVIAVYDFKDATLQGTYTVSSGVCTVNITDHGLETGQRVRLNFITGIGISGVYSITKVSNNQYTVQMNTISSTSGSVSTYPQSMRVYLFDNNGVRQTGGFGWAIRGY